MCGGRDYMRTQYFPLNFAVKATLKNKKCLFYQLLLYPSFKTVASEGDKFLTPSSLPQSPIRVPDGGNSLIKRRLRIAFLPSPILNSLRIAIIIM